MNAFRTIILLALGLATATTVSSSPSRVELVPDGGGWQLKRDGQHYFIKGAGGPAPLALLKNSGGNSIRTWGADNLQSVLDDAQKNGLTVCVGIWLHHENDTEKFSYDNPQMVRQQLDMVREIVTRFKDHPAVLLWGLGNEMEGEAGDKPAIWQAVEAAAKLTKQIDPNHPTMTVIAEIGGQKIPSLEKYCPDIDIVGINSYGGGPSLGERYAKSGCTKPYIVTEFGPVGSWETEKTSWGAAYEQTSTEKADWYRKIYTSTIANQPLCLGSYAFLWGQKQETTATWFGMFLKSGEKTGAVDAMAELWGGQAAAEKCAAIQPLKLVNGPQYSSGDTIQAKLETSDPAGKPLQVQWLVQPEQTHFLSAGAEENALKEFADLVITGDLQHAEIRAPKTPGGYRLFAYVRNGVGAAVANIPFYVSAPNQIAPGKEAKLPFAIYGAQGSAHFVPSGWMGNAKSVRMDEACRISPHSGDACLRFEYQDAGDWAGVAWQDPPGDWGDQPGGWNVTGAKKLIFWARGETGGETVNFKFGILGAGKKFPDSASGETGDVKLAKDWQQYSIGLTGKNLACLKTGFCWSLAGQGHPVTFYLDDIRFE
jgi:Glycosyl hydrolases family 2, TIM barrel domain